MSVVGAPLKVGLRLLTEILLGGWLFCLSVSHGLPSCVGLREGSGLGSANLLLPGLCSYTLHSLWAQTSYTPVFFDVRRGYCDCLKSNPKSNDSKYNDPMSLLIHSGDLLLRSTSHKAHCLFCFASLKFSRH